MPLVAHRHGKARVRVARVRRDGERHEFRELSVAVMVESDVARSFTDGDNTGVVATDTIKNLTNIVAAEQPGAAAEGFAQAVATRLLDRYAQVARVVVTTQETKWVRATVGGTLHPHAFTLDGNGKGFAEVDATRDGATTTSGVIGYALMKTTESGWAGFVRDDVTTLPETTDRILATSMDARWTWSTPPTDWEPANATILAAMLEAFATGYSPGVQASMFRMGEAALAAAPGLASITLACPNKHYLPLDLARFGHPAQTVAFTPTDEPHGQIECTLARA